jgi:flagellin-like protein
MVHKMRKMRGISPLVAVIMLIAFTLIIAGMLATFVTQMTETQTKAAKVCVDARVLLKKALFTDYGNASQEGNLTLTVYNYGKTNLRFKVLLSYSDETRHIGGIATHDTTFPVDAGKIHVVDLTHVGDDLTEVTVKSMQCDPPCYECQGAQDFRPYIDIKGLGY